MGIYESVGTWGKTAVKGGCRRGMYNAGSHLSDGVKGGVVAVRLIIVYIR